VKVRLTLEYWGPGFSGWQYQPGLKTVQGELEEAIFLFVNSKFKKMGLSPLPSAINITSSGRTDAGVHARRQVVSFDWPKALPFDAGKLRAALNGITSRDMVIHEVQVCPEDFDARHSPHIKCYCYTLLLRRNSICLDRQRAWRPQGVHLISSMIEASKLFVGEHDFSGFRAGDCSAKSTVRTILQSELVALDSEKFVYIAVGKGFLKQMIRTMVGTLVEVGKGRLAPADVAAILKSGDRVKAGPTAPAHGLELRWVRYTD